MRIPTAILILLITGAIPDPVESTERPWLRSVEEAIAEAKRTDSAILVDLYADWCGWCKKLESDVFSTPTFQAFAKDFVLLRVDTEDGGEGTRLQQRYEAYSLPTTLVIDQDKILIGAVPGYSPAQPYIAAIQTKIDAFDELVRGYERYGQSTDPRILGVLADEFHKRNDGRRAADLYRRILEVSETIPQRRLRIRYQLVDALRLASQYDEALAELEIARSDFPPGVADPMVERFDLLAAQISLDRGNCSRARSELEDFLTRHPASDLRRSARRSLAALEAEGFQCL